MTSINQSIIQSIRVWAPDNWVMAATAKATAKATAMRQVQFKLVLLGESAVGKSSIVQRFVKGSFDELRESTIGAAFLTQSVPLDDQDVVVKFEIWDTAGQERYRSLASMYYRNAHAALVVYDITSRESLDKAKYWIRELQKQANQDTLIVLVGNKSDMQDQRAITRSEVAAMAAEMGQGDRADDGDGDDNGIMTREVSAKTGDGVQELFRDVAMRMPIDKQQARGNSSGKGKTQGVDLRQRVASTNEQDCAC